MKKRKLLFLTAALLCLLMVFTACGKKESSGDNILDFFAPVPEKDTLLSSVSDIDGRVVAYDEKHNLVAIERGYDGSSDPDDVITYVYDLSDGFDDDLFSTGSYGGTQSSTVEVEFDYPIIRTVRKTETSGSSGTGYRYTYSYYRIQSSGETETIVSGLSDSDGGSNYSVRKINNLYVCRVDGKVYWIDSGLNVLRQFNADVTGDYSLPMEFFAEYKGYLYMHEFSELSRQVQIFNKEGVCQVQYTHSNDAGLAYVYMLNDGNLFVEEWVLVEDGKPYDLLYPMQDQSGDIAYKKVEIVSKLLNFKTGEVTELDLNFTVGALESAYLGYDDENSVFPFCISEKRENQAYIRYFSNGTLAAQPCYVVLDNSMNVEYTFKNDLIDAGYAGTWMNGELVMVALLPDGRYMVGAMVGSTGRQEIISYLYDKYGKVIFQLPQLDGQMIGDLVVLPNGIYTITMKKVYDFEKSFIAKEFNGSISEILSFNGRICLKLQDPLTDSYKYYTYDEDKRDFDLIAAGEDEVIDVIQTGFYYTVVNEEDDHYTLYSMNGKALLRTQGSMTITELDGMLIVQAYVDGKPVCYCVK